VLIGVVAVDDAMAVEGDRSVVPNGPISFDLPVQPLASTLESYSIALGWQVIMTPISPQGVDLQA
jgi:hypothetical protein